MVLTRLRLIPQNEPFFALFTRAAENVLEGARLLTDMLERPSEELDRKARHLKDIEHAGDEITRAIFDALHRTFVTPLERDDIAGLATALDDVLDWTEEAGRRMRLYHLTEANPVARRFGAIILQQAELIARAAALLERWKDAEELERIGHAIHRLENEGDDELADAIATLYDGVTDVPQVIRAMRWEDVYRHLEETTDRAEHVASVLQNIGVKRHR